MRWIYFILLVLAATPIETAVGQIIWIGTPVGPVWPMLLACVAVFVCLYGRSGIEAALAGWVLGMATDLTITGPGMGLLSVLYAAAAWGVFQIRTPFFCNRAATQFIMGLLFCVFAWEAWLACQKLFGSMSGAGYGAQALQVLLLSLYTAAVTPLVCAGLKRIERILFAPPSGGSRDRR